MLESIIVHSPILIMAVPLLIAFLTPLIDMVSERARNVCVLGGLLFAEFMALLLAHDIFHNGLRVYVLGAFPPGIVVPSSHIVPVRIILEVDALSIFMALITLTIAIVGTIYSFSAMREETGQGKFYTLVLLLTVGTVGMEFTGDMFNLFVFLELASISGAALAAFRVRFAEAVEGGFKYIVISTAVSLMILFAVGLFYAQYNLLNMGALAQAMQYTVLDKIALVFLVTGFLMKLGAVPLHMWLPDTYSVAPAGTTIMLMAASQAAMYALFRTCFTLYGVTLGLTTLGWTLIVFGILSMLVGVTMAVPQKDMKRLIAYNCICESGFMLLGVGAGLTVLGNPEALHTYGLAAMSGGIFHMVNYALFESLLFLAAGAVFYQIGTRNLNQMGGLAHNMRFTAILFLLGLLASSGIPPFNGFASKLLIYESVYQLNPLLSIVGILVSIITLAVLTRAFFSAFAGEALPRFQKIKGVPKAMIFGMTILSVMIVLFGLFPGLIVEWLARPAADALINQAAYIHGVMGITP